MRVLKPNKLLQNCLRQSASQRRHVPLLRAIGYTRRALRLFFAIFVGSSELPSSTWFLASALVCTTARPKRHLGRRSRFAGLATVINIHTDVEEQRQAVCSNGPHLCCACASDAG